jgi:hypothetical protein
LHWNDAVLRTPPGITEAGLFGDGFAAGVVGVAGDFVVFGPMRNQTEAAEQRLARRRRVVAHVSVRVMPNEGAFITRSHIKPRQFAGQVNAEMLVKQGFVVR